MLSDATKQKLRTHGRRLLIIPVLAIGIVVFVILVKTRKGPERVEAGEKTKIVRTIAAPSVELVPRALGYGTVQPEMIWEAVAQVSGKIIDMSPQLRSGVIVSSGTLLLRIDPAQYRLDVAREKANIESLKAKLSELDVQQSNLQKTLEIEQRTLALNEKDLERNRELLQAGSIPQSQFDQSERQLLAQRKAVQSLQNSLNLIPVQREQARANLAVARNRLETAQLNLEYTRIVAPFDCRIAQVNVEEQQFAPTGKVLAVADSIRVSEVPAQIPVSQFRHVVKREIPVFRGEDIDMQRVLDDMQLSAVVRFNAGDLQVEWDARVARLESIDPNTRTVPVVAAVRDSYRQAIPGVRPPLMKGMYCEVEVRGPAQSGKIVIPRSALHEDRIYLVNGDNRLEKRQVTIENAQSDFVVIADGVQAGDRVVVTDLIPAIDGMKLEPRADEDLQQRLIAEAEGKTSVR